MATTTTPPTLLRRSFKSGVWEVEVSAPLTPSITVKSSVCDDLLPVIQATGDGVFRAQLTLAPEGLSDGVQTFIMTDDETGTLLDRLSIVAGDALDDDIRAEMDLMRAELDLLKKAFRRHCADTM